VASLLYLFNIQIINIIPYLFIFSFILFYLDDFKLSNINIIKYIQIISFISIILYITYKILHNLGSTDIINYVNPKDNNNVNPNIDIHTTVSIGKDAAVEINKGLESIGSNIGLGASIVGLSTAVSKGLVKTAMPHLQKAGVILGSGLVSGLAHSVINNVNRNKILEDTTTTATIASSENTNDNISKLVDSFSISPLENLLFDIEALNSVCLSLVIILIMQIVFKFYVQNNIKLNLSNLVGISLNTKLEDYLNLIVKLNKKMSSIYI
jgi:hypothetical protein